MARPRKTGLDYFPFDTDFFSDEKIVCIAGEFGLKGEMIAIRLLCAIYRGKGYFIEWNEPLIYKLSKEMSGVSAELIKNTVKSLAKWGFFDLSLLDSVSILTSRAIQKRYFEAIKLRKTDFSSLVREYLLDPKIINSWETWVNSKETGVNSYRNPINKIKENEINKNNPNGLQKEADVGNGVLKNTAGAEALDGFIQELKMSQKWCEAICLRNRIERSAVHGYLDDYRLFCISEGVEHKTLQEVKCHFSRWLPRKIELQNRKKNETNNNNCGIKRSGLAALLPPEPGYGLIE